MKEDLIMQEVRQARRDLLKEAGGDLRKVIERANERAAALRQQPPAKPRRKGSAGS